MRRALFALYCAVVIVLSACSGPLPATFPSEPAQPPAQPDSIFLGAAASQQDAATRPSARSAVPPASAPDIDEVLETANESLEENDGVIITDLSVGQDEKTPLGAGSDLLVYSHYIEENEQRYQSFIGAFPDLPVSSSLALVNVNADYGYYKGISIIDDPGDLLVLCNKNFQLPTDYAPSSMRNIDGTAYKMRYEAASAFERMRQAVKDELGLSLVVLSAYRDYSYQRALYNRYAAADGAAVADTYSARAGHSEHQTGLAVDFLHKSPSGSLRGAGFQNTAQYAWLQSHAHTYGFILRYPEDSESITGYRFEPWHWRFIGVEDATRMVEEGFNTFEEYYGTYY